jgi:UPF0716 family protein affecting phage T7 exclusion
MPSDSPISIIQAVFLETPGLTTSIFGLILIAVVSLWFAVRAVTKREYVLEQ